MVSCGVRLSEVGFSEFRKPQVTNLSCQHNSLNFKAEDRCQRWLVHLPSTKPSSLDPEPAY